MSNIDITVKQVITIAEVASIAIKSIVLTYNFIDANKDKYLDFFESILRYMDAMEISESNLSGSQKKLAVLVKVKELAFDLDFDWGRIGELVMDLIDDAKKIYNDMLSTRLTILNKLDSVGL